MLKINKASLFASVIGSLAAGYALNRIVGALQTFRSDSVVPSVDELASHVMASIQANPLSLVGTREALLGAAFGFIVVWLIYFYKLASDQYRRPGEEHGSSRWGTKADIKPFVNKTFSQNIILAQDVYMNIDERVPNPKFSRNKNVCIIGGSGTGKTRFFVKPNLMQMHSSYVITDPKGTLYDEMRGMFERNGYEVRAFNTVDMSRSCCFNPLSYITCETDILEVVNCIIENTKGKGEKSNEDFWVKSERLLYNAVIAYLFDWYGYDNAEDNPNISLPKVMELLLLASASEEDESYVSELDELFNMLEEKRGECFSVRQYKKFKQAAGKTMKSILISCSARLAPFDIPEVCELMSKDEVNIRDIGEQAYKDFDGRLPIHVRFMLDEFANLGVIPDADKKLSVMRSRNISASIVLQSISQLDKNYKDTKETIIDNCDSLLVLGSKSTKTNKEIAEQIGKTTVHNTSVTESKGQSGNYSEADQILGRYLIDPAEIGRMERDECLVLITGVTPFKAKKYPLEKHPRYREISER